jgi:hypothetical protein
MLRPPKTREEARAYRYRQWTGNPKGNAWNEAHCAYEVPDSNPRSCLFNQCSLGNGYGPAALYCKRHAKKVSS